MRLSRSLFSQQYITKENTKHIVLGSILGVSMGVCGLSTYHYNENKKIQMRNDKLLTQYILIDQPESNEIIDLENLKDKKD